MMIREIYAEFLFQLFRSFGIFTKTSNTSFLSANTHFNYQIYESCVQLEITIIFGLVTLLLLRNIPYVLFIMMIIQFLNIMRIIVTVILMEMKFEVHDAVFLIFFFSVSFLVIILLQLKSDEQKEMVVNG